MRFVAILAGAVACALTGAAQDFPQGVDLVQRIDNVYPWLYGLAFDVDGRGNTYLAGYAVGTIPVTVNMRVGPLGGADIVVIKVDPTGRLIYAAAIGGTQDEGVGGIKADSAGNIYLFGSTDSPDYPAMSSQPSTNAAVVLKLDPSGNMLYNARLDWAAEILAIGLDLAGNLYIGGEPQLGTMPVSPGAYGQISYGSNGFIAKLDRSGALASATYIEGPVSNLAVRANGDVLFSMGRTIAGLEKSLSRLLFSTLADVDNYITNMALDSSNNIYVAVPHSVQKYSPDGAQVLWARNVAPAAFPQFAVTASGTVFLFGKAPPNYPTHNETQSCGPNLLSPILNVPLTDLGFLMVIDPDGQLLYATFMAGIFPILSIAECQYQPVTVGPMHSRGLMYPLHGRGS